MKSSVLQQSKKFDYARKRRRAAACSNQSTGSGASAEVASNEAVHGDDATKGEAEIKTRQCKEQAKRRFETHPAVPRAREPSLGSAPPGRAPTTTHGSHPRRLLRPSELAHFSGSALDCSSRRR